MFYLILEFSDMSLKSICNSFDQMFPSGAFVQIYTFLLMIEYFVIEPDTKIMGLSAFIVNLLIYAELMKRPFITLKLKKFIPYYHLLCGITVLSAVFLRQASWHGLLWSSFTLLSWIEFLFLTFSADKWPRPADLLKSKNDHKIPQL